MKLNQFNKQWIFNPEIQVIPPRDKKQALAILELLWFYDPNNWSIEDKEFIDDAWKSIIEKNEEFEIPQNDRLRDIYTTMYRVRKAKKIDIAHTLSSDQETHERNRYAQLWITKENIDPLYSSQISSPELQKLIWKNDFIWIMKLLNKVPENSIINNDTFRYAIGIEWDIKDRFGKMWYIIPTQDGFVMTSEVVNKFWEEIESWELSESYEDILERQKNIIERMLATWKKITPEKIEEMSISVKNEIDIENFLDWLVDEWKARVTKKWNYRKAKTESD